GAPMYNFGIASHLKAWIDRIAIAGKTFSYTADGPIGLAGGKHVIVASSRGGRYAPGMPFEANDFQEKYLRAVFAFLGIGDIEIIRAEGLALSPAHREAALNMRELWQAGRSDFKGDFFQMVFAPLPARP